MNLLIGILMVVACACAQSFFSRNRFRRFPGDTRAAPRISLKQRFTNRIMQHRQRNTARVCYDTVGCFEVPHSRSPLQKTPEAPETLDTKFFLFRRNINFSEPEVIYYEDGGKSLSASKFNFEQPLRIFIHGYMSKWNERGAFVFADSFLKMNDSNFIVMDWSKGARGPQYTTAAANTELAGRQLGILLMAMINNGLSSKKIHLIGFSLGAHVAGCASELLKSNGKMLGRITGLDAAGPLFRHNHLKERSKKLDISDADFVDVLHTDSSPVFVDGFGLWEPIGHVDYFANGGQEQPGCTDRHPSVVVTTFERTLSRDTACSHIRAVHLFLEYLQNKLSGNGCEFTAFKCPGGLPSLSTVNASRNLGIGKQINWL
ncbi:PREDICTED: pancreatic triacylglycerol lipase-like [Nicrophorus vespilloides]|uniref:Pancreatic triacylglycerol lipase-like n=1 Tax=Nicrophorus vespilloides TaxID=110193 RepID=A0ABM1MUT5_NICVS|nr:PREDICTED: pancreatic triacylglycerol lipase-like [Nicrophorus vespilloides]